MSKMVFYIAKHATIKTQIKTINWGVPEGMAGPNYTNM